MKRIFSLLLIITVSVGAVACGGGSGGNGNSTTPPENNVGPFDGSWNIAIFQGAAPTDTLAIQYSQIKKIQKLTITDNEIFAEGEYRGDVSDNTLDYELIDSGDVTTVTGTFNSEFVSGTWSSSNGSSGTWEGRKVNAGVTDEWLVGNKLLNTAKEYNLLMLERLDGNLLLGYDVNDQFYAGSAFFDGNKIQGSLDSPDGIADITCHFFGSYIDGFRQDTIQQYLWSGFKQDDFSIIKITYAYIQYRPQRDETVFFTSLESINGNPVPPGIITGVEIADNDGNIYPPTNILYDDGGEMDGWNCNGTCVFEYWLYSGVFGRILDSGSLPVGEYTMTLFTNSQTLSYTMTFDPNLNLPAPPDPVNSFDPDGNLTITWDPPPTGVQVKLQLSSGLYGNMAAGFNISDPNQTAFTIPAAVLDQMDASDLTVVGSRVRYQHFIPNVDGSSNQTTRTFGLRVPF